MKKGTVVVQMEPVQFLNPPVIKTFQLLPFQSEPSDQEAGMLMTKCQQQQLLQLSL